MRLVIDISEDDYSAIMSRIEYSEGYNNAVDNAFMAIAHGTPTPKSCDSLIDADKLRENWIFGRVEKETIDAAEVIVPAEEDEE